MKKLTALFIALLLACSPVFAGITTAGDADRLERATNLGITSHPITVSMWVNLAGTSLQGAFFNIGDIFSGSGDGIGIGVGLNTFEKPANSGNELIVLYNHIRWIDTNDAIGTGSHHIAVTVNSSGHCEAWLDGVEVYTEGSGTAPVTTYSSSLYIGGYIDSISAGGPYDRYVAAGINEVAVWNTVLADAEIVTLARSRVKGLPLQIKPSNLKLYAPLDEKTGGSALSTTSNDYRDASGGGFHLTGIDADGDSLNASEAVLTYP